MCSPNCEHAKLCKILKLNAFLWNEKTKDGTHRSHTIWERALSDVYLQMKLL